MSKSLEFYQLERAPFEDGVRDAAAVGTRPLRAALERARRFVETETAVVCVTGRPGVGKTYFALALPSVLPAGTLIARIGQPGQPWSALHAAIAKGFDLDPHGFGVDALHDLRDTDRRLVIEIDAVEQLQLDSVTPLLSLLSHAYLPERRLVQAVLIGDLERLPETAREGLAQLGSATLELEALPESDVPAYVQKRLDRAGYRGQPLFSRPACAEIRRRAEGVPREINRICSAALELAALRRSGSIGPELIRDVCDALPAVPARAVIGRVKLETRVQLPRPAALPAAPSSGHLRRIEPLPPEPVVQAEPETPLVDAVFVDEEEPSTPPPPAAAPVPVVRTLAPAESVPIGPPPAVEPRPASVAVETAPGPPRPARAAPVAASPAQPVTARRVRTFPWVHVGVSLAASWAVAAGLFWAYTHATRPEPASAPAPPRMLAEPAPSAFEATSVLPEPRAELLTSAQTPPADAPEVPAAPESQVQTASAAPLPETPPAATPPVQAVPASPSPQPVPAARPRRPAAAPAAPLRVELRARGREVLYPPRPASAYVTPAR